MKYYKKYVPDTKLLLSTGRYYPFDRIDASIGLTMTDDPGIQGELAAAIRGERGGVVEITKAEYDEIKKKEQELPLPPSSREEIRFRRQDTVSPSHNPQEVAVALEEPPASTRTTVHRKDAPLEPSPGKSTHGHKPKSVKR